MNNEEIIRPSIQLVFVTKNGGILVAQKKKGSFSGSMLLPGRVSFCSAQCPDYTPEFVEAGEKVVGVKSNFVEVHKDESEYYDKKSGELKPFAIVVGCANETVELDELSDVEDKYAGFSEFNLENEVCETGFPPVTHYVLSRLKKVHSQSEKLTPELVAKEFGAEMEFETKTKKDKKTFWGRFFKD